MEKYFSQFGSNAVVEFVTRNSNKGFGYLKFDPPGSEAEISVREAKILGVHRIGGKVFMCERAKPTEVRTLCNQC